jgi:predicted AlkP superfamily pyrophosphatase or phosphodiesterase
MKRFPFALLLCVNLIAPLFAAEIPPKERMVILITIDGFPAWLWEDPSLPMPTLRKLAHEGASAKAMTISNPAVTWPNHTTLVTGVPPAKHGVLYNGLLLRPAGLPPKLEPWKDKAALVRVPTVYDLAFKSGLTTAQVDWVPTTNSMTMTWEFPEIPNPDGVIEKDLAAAGVLDAAGFREFTKRNPTWRDMVWTKAAVHIAATRRPNLLLFHLLVTDAHNHKYGPGSPPSHTAFAFADACVRELLDAIEAAGMKEKVTVFITTDHGFKTAKRIIRPNVLLRREGFLQLRGPAVAACDAYVSVLGGSAMVFATHPEKRATLLPRLKALLAKMEGIDRILEPEDYPALGLPTPKQNGQMGDLLLLAKAGYGFHVSALGEEAVTDLTPDVYAGHHGYLNSDREMDGVFFAWGRGIQPGARLERIANLDVAPTVAALLGLEMKGVDGRVLRELLK